MKSYLFLITLAFVFLLFGNICADEAFKSENVAERKKNKKLRERFQNLNKKFSHFLKKTKKLESSKNSFLGKDERNAMIQNLSSKLEDLKEKRKNTKNPFKRFRIYLQEMGVKRKVKALSKQVEEEEELEKLEEELPIDSSPHLLSEENSPYIPVVLESTARDIDGKESHELPVLTKYARIDNLHDFGETSDRFNDLADEKINEEINQGSVKIGRKYDEGIDDEGMDNERIDNERIDSELMDEKIDDRFNDERLDNERTNAENVDEDVEEKLAGIYDRELDTERMDSEKIDDEKMDDEKVDEETIDNENIADEEGHKYTKESRINKLLDNEKADHEGITENLVPISENQDELVYKLNNSTVPVLVDTSENYSNQDITTGKTSQINLDKLKDNKLVAAMSSAKKNLKNRTELLMEKLKSIFKSKKESSSESLQKILLLKEELSNKLKDTESKLSRKKLQQQIENLNAKIKNITESALDTVEKIKDMETS